MDVQPPHHLRLSWIGTLFMRRRAQPSRTCRFARGFWEPSQKGRSDSRKLSFLLRKLGFRCLGYDVALELVWVPTWANPEDVPFTEQTDRKLVRIVAKASASTDRGFRVSPCPLGAGTAP